MIKEEEDKIKDILFFIKVNYKDQIMLERESTKLCTALSKFILAY
jgi:hypothetical protein